MCYIPFIEKLYRRDDSLIWTYTGKFEKQQEFLKQIDVNSGSHADYFKAFQNYFHSEMNLGIDKQCSDVSRACYLSWDCNSYLNENSQILGKDFIDKYLPEEIIEIHAQ